MSDPTVHFEAKLQRAEELVVAVRDAIDEFFTSDPVTARTEHHRDDHRVEMWVESVQQPPLRLGVLIGEFVHDLRSTLDQLVWSLALTKVATPHHRHQFPICRTLPNSWEPPTSREKIASDRLRSVPAAAVERIWQAQPCNGEQPEINALTIVQALSNDDKHRVILRPLSIPKEPSSDQLQVVTHDVLEQVHIEMIAGAPVEPGTRLFAVDYTPTGPRPQVHVQARVPAEVLFGDLAFRAVAMPGVLEAIRRLVRSFDGFFG